jgi:hypothetical protein
MFTLITGILVLITGLTNKMSIEGSKRTIIVLGAGMIVSVDGWLLQ